jgi:hypothetical protein
MYVKRLPLPFVAIPYAVYTTEYECRIRYVDVINRTGQWRRLYSCIWDSDIITDELDSIPRVKFLLVSSVCCTWFGLLCIIYW